MSALLKELNIIDFALIDELKINFVNGFNVFTGETGAGKSIIMDALSFVLGKRADKSFIRKTKNKSSIEATFFLENNSSEIQSLFSKEDIDFNGGTVYIQRELYEDGHSTCRINGRSATLSFLKKITGKLISIHEQNEFDDILIRENQLSVLDKYMKIIAFEGYIGYCDIYDQYNKIKKEMDELENSTASYDVAREIDILQYQINEIEKTLPLLKQAEKIERKINKLEKSEEISEIINGIYGKIYQEEDNIIDNINNILRKCERFSDIDERIHEWTSSFYDCLYILEDISRSISSNIEDFYFDENLLRELVDQNNVINKIFSKYGKSYQEVKNFYDNSAERLDYLSTLDEKKKEKLIELNNLEKKLKIFAEGITAKRKNEAIVLENNIKKELFSLGMSNAQFQINFLPLERYSSTGKDDIQFMVSFNKGEELKPLNKVASGGELSRFVLSLKRVTAKTDGVDTMIFDEIDSGISGVAANTVGKKLKEISREKQVICITHLPQIAANGDFHYLVSKIEDEKNTYTKVKLLEKDSRVLEISKMLSGEDVSNTSINYAKELLNDSKSILLK